MFLPDIFVRLPLPDIFVRYFVRPSCREPGSTRSHFQDIQIPFVPGMLQGLLIEEVLIK